MTRYTDVINVTGIFYALSYGFDIHVHVKAYRYVNIRVTYGSKYLTLIRQNDISDMT